MSESPPRLQGTDGVRGEVAADGDRRAAGMSAVEAFVRRGLITPSFVELYCYAFAEELLESGLAAPGDEIVVGYDPRDPERRLVTAALDGVAKAGAVPVDVGVLPTPGIGLYAVSRGAGGAVVVTASHNPPDQNGIKLFLPDLGLKLFPADDARLTARMYALEGIDLSELKPLHGVIDGAAEALSTFESFFSDPYNTWVGEDDFGDTILVVDAANGALAGLAAPILERFGFRALEEVGAADDGSVNVNCGAGLLEGHGRIGPDFISDAGGDFRTIELAQALFRHGRAHREEMRGGTQGVRVRVSGAAFDADGDRFYRLEYDPFEDSVLILSGDELAYHQAWFLRRRLGERYNGASVFATTVESDINAAAAAEELGFIGVHTGVGDKWLLWEAHCHLLGARWEVLNENIAEIDRLARIEEMGNRFLAQEEADGREMIGFVREAERMAEECGLDLNSLLREQERHTFAVGSEETGHAITCGRVALREGGERLVYFGDGLKSAVNTFAASRELANEAEGREYYRRLHRPFPPGYKRTIPVYYTDRSLLRPGSEAWSEIKGSLIEGARRRFGGLLEPEFRPRVEEPEMIYLALDELAAEGIEETTRAAIFVRNSGTEEKTSVYLRGAPRFAAELDALGEELAVRIGALMKRADSPYARAELAVLERIEERGPAAFSELADLLSEVNAERLLVEMSAKERLLEVKGEKLALTERGRRVLGALEEER